MTDHASVLQAFQQLDGTTRSAIRLLTGASDQEIDALGGVTDDA